MPRHMDSFRRPDPTSMNDQSFVIHDWQVHSKISQVQYTDVGPKKSGIDPQVFSRR
jgi:hypothetical protein